MVYELTIHCHVCGYKQAIGGLDAQANLSIAEVKALSQHNPRCKVDAICCAHKLSISNDVEITDTATITHYDIQLM